MKPRSEQTHRAIFDLLEDFMKSFDEKDFKLMRECLCDRVFCDYSSLRGDAPAEITADEYVQKRRIAGANLKMQSSITKGYLSELYVGLSSLNPIQRVASMVAFERHAQQMIDALWSSLARLFSANKHDLLYFKIHVGGDDPAEIYHVNMTFQMIDEIIKPTDHDEFFERFERAYAQNFNWCKDLVEYKL